MSPTPKEMGTRLKALRKKKSLSRQELAALAGVSREYVRLLEAGRYDPTVGVLQRLAKALGVPVTEMLRGQQVDRQKLASDVLGARTALREGKAARGIRTLANMAEQIEEYGFIARILRRERDANELDKWLTILLDELINRPSRQRQDVSRLPE